MKVPKQANCKIKDCNVQFPQINSLHIYCSPSCAIKDYTAKAAKRQAKDIKDSQKASRAITRQLKEKAKTRSDWLREAQAEFNKFIRLRDEKDPCISCGRYHQGQYHAGHYLSIGSSLELRFNEDNCHRQCAPCNNHLSGNQIRYRQGLIKKIGEDKVLWLEGPHTLPKLGILEIKAIKEKYKIKAKSILC
jgi:hypothetical protein